MVATGPAEKEKKVIFLKNKPVENIYKKENPQGLVLKDNLKKSKLVSKSRIVRK